MEITININCDSKAFESGLDKGKCRFYREGGFEYGEIDRILKGIAKKVMIIPISKASHDLYDIDGNHCGTVKVK